MQLNGHARRDETETPPGPVRTWENPAKRSPRGNQGDATESWNPRCAHVFVARSFAAFRRVRANICRTDPYGIERARVTVTNARSCNYSSSNLNEIPGELRFSRPTP